MFGRASILVNETTFPQRWNSRKGKNVRYNNRYQSDIRYMILGAQRSGHLWIRGFKGNTRVAEALKFFLALVDRYYGFSHCVMTMRPWRQPHHLQGEFNTKKHDWIAPAKMFTAALLCGEYF